jgi:hypothetical protein
MHPVHGPVCAADQMQTIITQELSRTAVEWNRQMPTEVAIRDDAAVFVAQKQRVDRASLRVEPELGCTDFTGAELLLSADPGFHRFNPSLVANMRPALAPKPDRGKEATPR